MNSMRWTPEQALVLALMATLMVACGSRSTSAIPKVGGPTTTKAVAAQDLTGIWKRTLKLPDNKRKYTVLELTFQYSQELPELTPWAQERFVKAKSSFGPRAVPWKDTNDPDKDCFPPGVPKIYLERATPFEILQTPAKVVIIYEYDHYVRQIFTDGRPHADLLVPTWMGDSIGHWEGDTLVADSIGFNDKTWLDMYGRPHSEELHVVERIRRPSKNLLMIDLNIEDPKALKKPWLGHMEFDLKPSWTLGESICKDNVSFDSFEAIRPLPK